MDSARASFTSSTLNNVGGDQNKYIQLHDRVTFRMGLLGIHDVGSLALAWIGIIF
jgi:hypothetical protein